MTYSILYFKYNILCLNISSIFFLLPVLLNLLKHVKLIVRCELLFENIKWNIKSSSTIWLKIAAWRWWSKRKIYYCGPWRTAYHWGLKEDPITEDPEENTINEKPKEDPVTVKPKDNCISKDPQDLQDPQWLFHCKKKLFLPFW